MSKLPGRSLSGHGVLGVLLLAPAIYDVLLGCGDDHNLLVYIGAPLLLVSGMAFAHDTFAHDQKSTKLAKQASSSGLGVALGLAFIAGWWFLKFSLCLTW